MSELWTSLPVKVWVTRPCTCDKKWMRVLVDAELGRRALQVLLDVGFAVPGRHREAQARVGARRDAAVAREERMSKAGSAQERTFQELGVFRHGSSFMRPAGPVVQVSVVESELWHDESRARSRVRARHARSGQ